MSENLELMLPSGPAIPEIKQGIIVAWHDKASGKTVNVPKGRWFDTYEDDLMRRLSPPPSDDEIRHYAKLLEEHGAPPAEEVLAYLHEMNVEARREFCWLDPKDYADEDARIGRPLHSSKLITVLRDRCHMNIWYGEPCKGRLALLIQPGDAVDPCYAGWVQEGHMPEYSLMHFDEYGVVTNEKMRGWRTVLLQLIIKGFLAETVATAVFGAAEGPCSARYNATLFGFRNRERKGLEEAATVVGHGLMAADELPIDAAPEPETAPCEHCHRRIGHNADCPEYAKLMASAI